MTEEVRNDVGYPRDNEGNLILDEPMKVFGDMVLLENRTKTILPNMNIQEGDLSFFQEKVESENLGGWTVVAVGENVVRVKPGDFVGTPIANSFTVVQHPWVAKKKKIVNDMGIEVEASKVDVDHVYAIVNQQLIGMKYGE